MLQSRPSCELAGRLMHLARTLLVALTSILGLFAACAQASPEADFWKWFERNEAALFDFERDQEKVFDQLEAAMHKVHPSLTFELGPKHDGQCEFVISADGDREAFPKVESLFGSAPALPRWKFVKFRSRREPSDLEYKGVSIKARSVSVLLEPDGGKAGLTVIIPGYTKAAHATYAEIAVLLLDQALGEFDVETRVGFVEVQAPSPESAGAHSLRELPKAFDSFFAKR